MKFDLAYLYLAGAVMSRLVLLMTMCTVTPPQRERATAARAAGMASAPLTASARTTRRRGADPMVWKSRIMQGKSGNARAGRGVERGALSAAAG